MFFAIFAQLSGGHLRFCVLQALNLSANLLFKNTVRQPRPTGSVSVNRWDKYDEDQFGMPSSHAQMVGGMLAFVLVHRLWSGPAALVLTALTIWQRYVYRKHTLAQLAVGALLGGTLTLLFEFDALRGRQVERPL